MSNSCLFSFRLTLFLSSFTLPDSSGLDWPVIAFFFVGLALIVAFYVVEHKVEYPLIPVRLLKGNIPIIVVSSCILGMSMMGLTQFILFVFLSPESSVIKEKKMINIGAVINQLGTIELVMSHVTGVTVEKIGFSLCIFIGAPMQAVSMTLFTFFHSSSSKHFLKSSSLAISSSSIHMVIKEGLVQ